MEKQPQFPHKLTLNERSNLTMTGVEDIASFDDNAVILHTGAGTLTVQGKDLKLKTLQPDGGQVTIDGRICALSYEEPRTAGGFWRRLFG